MGNMLYFSQTFVILQNGFLYTQDETFSTKPHETSKQSTLVFDNIICPCQSFELLVSSTKMNYFEVMFSEVPKIPTQNDHMRVERKKNIKN